MNSELTHGNILNEKHLELLYYLKSREPFKATYREMIRHTTLGSFGSVDFALKTLEARGLVERVARSTYKVNIDSPVHKPIHTVELDDDQRNAIRSLVNDEIHRNINNGDSAYNTYWGNLLSTLGFIN